MARQGMQIRGETVEEKVQSIGLILKKMNNNIKTMSFLISGLMLKVERLQREKIHDVEPTIIRNLIDA